MWAVPTCLDSRPPISVRCSWQPSKVTGRPPLMSHRCSLAERPGLLLLLLLLTTPSRRCGGARWPLHEPASRLIFTRTTPMHMGAEAGRDGAGATCNGRALVTVS